MSSPADAQPPRRRLRRGYLGGGWLATTHLTGFYLIGAGLSGAPAGFFACVMGPGLGLVVAGWLLLAAGPALVAAVTISPGWGGVTAGYMALPFTPVFWFLAIVAARVVA